jgi:N-acetylglucosaminyldiphosphoundecaprenol N-acetyl-beta-D-mannosaminyltransferase
MNTGRLDAPAQIRTILGISFFTGTVDEVVDRLLQKGGLLVVPAAPALMGLQTNKNYRDALVQADTVITDSAYMVLLWNLFERDNVPRISGLRYSRALLERPQIRLSGRTFWIMAGPRSARRNLEWLASQDISIPKDYVYLAPMYSAGEVEDIELLEQIQRVRPDHIIVTLGGMTQECLGSYLRQKLDYRPGIHCIGAAIAFLSGDQIHIPDWADRAYLGWLFRSLSNPKRYIPRYWRALLLAPLLLQYKSTMPPPLVPLYSSATVDTDMH